MSETNTIGVVGAGTMGHGIAQVALVAGYRVLLVDAAREALDRGLAGIQKGLGKLVEKGKLEAGARDEAWSRLEPGSTLQALAQADLVVEAVVEKLEVKAEVLTRLGGLVRCGSGGDADRRAPARARHGQRRRADRGPGAVRRGDPTGCGADGRGPAYGLPVST